MVYYSIMVGKPKQELKQPVPFMSTEQKESEHNPATCCSCSAGFLHCYTAHGMVAPTSRVGLSTSSSDQDNLPQTYL